MTERCDWLQLTHHEQRELSTGCFRKREVQLLLGALLLMSVTVQPGQTLSGIAASHGVSLAAVEQANPQISNPNLIFAGQHVSLRGSRTGARHFTHHSTASGKTYGVSYGYPNYCGDGDGDGWDVACGQHVSQPVTRGAHSSWTPTSNGYSSSSSGQSSSSGSSASHSYSAPSSSSSGGGLGNVPGVPSSFAQCVAYHESTNGTNQAYNGGVYGIINASGYHVNGQSVSAQKQAFSQIYNSVGPKAWAGDGCTG